MKRNELLTLAGGVALGIGIGILIAPKSGEETRKDLNNRFNDLLERAKSIESKELKKEFNNRIKELQKELKELDTEEVIEIARQKAEEISRKAQDLVELAHRCGNAILVRKAIDFRKKAILVADNVIANLGG